MKKYVYKVTNNVNGKVYIGQTNNVKRRIQEHKHDKRRGYKLHAAIKQYGWENFSVETLYYGEDFNEKEKYYIGLFRANDPEHGYNVHVGGNDEKGESNPASILKQKDVDRIIEELLTTDMTYDEIAVEHGVNRRYIENINKGASWRKDGMQYPLKRFVKRLSSDSLSKIVSLLKDESVSLSEIEEITGEERYTILDVNKGHHWKLDGEIYPIRDLKPQRHIYDKIIELLKDSDLDIQGIADEFGLNRSVVYKINSGKVYKQQSLDYPIRRLSTKRNELGKYESGYQS